jgi:exopolysaccharide biosynthesis WecB/TagA/CpsF family protein
MTSLERQHAGIAPGRETGACRFRPAAELREFLGLRFWDVDLETAARFLVQQADAGRRLEVYFVNAHCVNVAARDAAYAALLEQAPFLFADGFGMSLAARFAGLRLEHNVNGTDLFPVLCRTAAAAGVPIALLGARPGVAQACADRMQRSHPGLRVAWTGHGYLDRAEELAAIDAMNASGAKVVFVAKGVPAQERWIAAHRARLEAPVVLGVGALFDFYSGTVRRAPRLVRRLRSEWVYRLAREPRRMAGRYLLGNPAFLARAAAWRALGQPVLRRDGGAS